MSVRYESREADLLAHGWTRRFAGAPPRLKEAVQVYTDLGFEVHLEPQAPEEIGERCEGCLIALKLFRVVYTRPRRSPIA
ncbi:MAG TPA: hypothetical protein VEC38_04740 [Candidatus Binataceae bacterium]|nr:hypothetical protein [Candidatus Binataceae bacterium]